MIYKLKYHPEIIKIRSISYIVCHDINVALRALANVDFFGLYVVELCFRSGGIYTSAHAFMTLCIGKFFENVYVWREVWKRARVTE